MKHVTASQINQDLASIRNSIVESDDDILDTVNKQLKVLGVHGHVQKDDGKMETVFSGHLETKTLGLVAHIFDGPIKLDVRAGAEGNSALIELEYNWEHIKGRNGYRMLFRFDARKGWTIEGR